MTKRFFTDFMDGYLEHTSDHEATPKIHMWTAISVIAAALERRVWLDRGFYTLYPNLYIFIIGKSGIMKKSTSTGIGVSLVKDTKNLSVMSDRLTSASLITQMEKSFNPFKYDGKAVNQSAVYAYASELAVFLGEVHGSIIELLTTFYDCVPHDPTKPWTHSTKTQGENCVYGPCLNILGASTVPWLRKNLPDSELEAGFASRIIFIVENKGPDRFIAWPEIKKKNIKVRKNLLDDLAIISKLNGPIMVTRGAREYYENWYQSHMSERDYKWSDKKFCGYSGRKGDHVLKIAIVRSVARGNTLEVSRNDIVWAIKLLNSIEPEMFDIFDYSKSDVDADKKDIVLNLGYSIHKHIIDRPLTSRKDIIKIFAKGRTYDLVEQELQELMERFLIVPETKAGEEVYRANKDMTNMSYNNQGG